MDHSDPPTADDDVPPPVPPKKKVLRSVRSQSDPHLQLSKKAGEARRFSDNPQAYRGGMSRAAQLARITLSLPDSSSVPPPVPIKKKASLRSMSVDSTQSSATNSPMTPVSAACHALISAAVAKSATPSSRRGGKSPPLPQVPAAATMNTETVSPETSVTSGTEADAAVQREKRRDTNSTVQPPHHGSAPNEEVHSSIGRASPETESTALPATATTVARTCRLGDSTPSTSEPEEDDDEEEEEEDDDDDVISPYDNAAFGRAMDLGAGKGKGDPEEGNCDFDEFASSIPGSNIGSASASASTSGSGRRSTNTSIASAGTGTSAADARLSKFCAAVRFSILSLKTEAVVHQTNLGSWLRAFAQMEQSYVNGFDSLLALKDNLNLTKYKSRAGHKIRNSRFLLQSVPLVEKISALHTELLHATSATTTATDTIQAATTLLKAYLKMLKKLLWVQIPYANAYAPAVADLKRLSRRKSVQRSTTLRTNVAEALSHLGDAVGYGSRNYAFFSKFLEAARDEGIGFVGDVAGMPRISEQLLPAILEELEEIAAKCTSTALEGHLQMLLRRFPGLGSFVEDQELLNYGTCEVEDLVRKAATDRGSSGGATCTSAAANISGEAELFLFNKMILKVSINVEKDKEKDEGDASLLHGIMLERDDMCLTPEGEYAPMPSANVSVEAQGTKKEPRGSVGTQHRSHVNNLTNSFQINFGPEFIQVSAVDTTGKTVFVVPRTQRQHCCWNVTPTYNVGSVKPLNRIVRRAEPGQSLKLGDAVNAMPLFRGDEVAQWYEGVRLCCEFQQKREEQEAKLMVCCIKGDETGVRALMEEEVSPNGRALLREDTALPGAYMCSALEVALLHKNQAIARLLIRGGANIYRPDSTKNKPLAMRLYFTNAELLQEYRDVCTPSEEDFLEDFLHTTFRDMVKLDAANSAIERGMVRGRRMGLGTGSANTTITTAAMTSSSSSTTTATTTTTTTNNTTERRLGAEKKRRGTADGRMRGTGSRKNVLDMSMKASAADTHGIGPGGAAHSHSHLGVGGGGLGMTSASGGDDKGDEEDSQEASVFHFSQPLRFCQCELVSGYNSPIPSVLVYLKEAWIAAGGANDEGVFRVACDAKRSDAIEEYLFSTCLLSKERLRDFAPDLWKTSALPARIVKRFFRAMPEGGLIPLPELVKAFPELGASTSWSTDRIPDMLKLLEPQRYAVFVWLLDWLVLPAANEKSTRMNPNNLSIVFGPNLYEQKMTGNVDAMMAIKYSKIINEFTKTALEWRISLGKTCPM